MKLRERNIFASVCHSVNKETFKAGGHVCQGACMAGGVHSREYAWQGVHVEGSLHGRVYVAR